MRKVWDPVEEPALIRDNVAALNQRHADLRALFLAAEAAVSHVGKFERVTVPRQNLRPFEMGSARAAIFNDPRFWGNSKVEVVRIAPLDGVLQIRP